ncbi:unnamed protein product [Hymenolepis diminuta]|uniref:Uncharacterized protein n=1 Tax=Hymenolepis diminuta TaxID=6216 RepID=A0A564YV26_HYMDI|nr:unnamed protein product [Hymenolepis diminuta]
MKLLLSVRDRVKVTSLTQPMEFSISKVDPRRLISETTVVNQQSVLPINMLDRHTNQIC